MANNENLKPFNKMCSEVAVKIQAKGGKQKAENAKLNKTMAAIGQAIAKCEPTADLVEELKSKYPEISGEIIDNKVLLVATLFEEALKGNLAAIAMFRDTIGEKPVDKQDIAHTGNLVANYSVCAASVAAGKKADEARVKIDE